MGIKYKVDEEFFDKWSYKMAYVLGFIYADGSLENALYLRGKYVRMTSTDKDVLEKIQRVMNSEHRLYVDKPKENHKTKYILRIGSHKLYDSLEERGVHPNKSLNMRLPKIPKKYFGSFLRGYFDGDGCVHLEKKDKFDAMSIKRLTVVFTSGSKFFLEELLKCLQEMEDVVVGKVYNSHRSLQLRFATEDSKKIFCLLYNDVVDELFLDRKLQKFLKYFTLRPFSVDRRVKRTILRLNGHVVK